MRCRDPSDPEAVWPDGCTCVRHRGHSTRPGKGNLMARRITSQLERLSPSLAWVVLLALCVVSSPSCPATGAEGKPNILVIMGDDVGWFNVGAYHRGMMSGKTPNLDKLAAQGMMFTDYYAEASCTAGRANFITGELPIRTGLTTVGQAGADVGIPDQAITLATAVKAQGYETFQYGKNH